MNGDRLFEELRTIAARLERDSIRLIVAGGYGLLLREMHLRAAGREPRRPLGAEALEGVGDYEKDVERREHRLRLERVGVPAVGGPDLVGREEPEREPAAQLLFGGLRELRA